jgi:hypothetical protein
LVEERGCLHTCHVFKREVLNEPVGKASCGNKCVCKEVSIQDVSNYYAPMDKVHCPLCTPGFIPWSEFPVDAGGLSLVGVGAQLPYGWLVTGELFSVHRSVLTRLETELQICGERLVKGAHHRVGSGCVPSLQLGQRLLCFFLA